MTPAVKVWAPAVMLGVGALLVNLGVKTQRALDLREPLGTSVPRELGGLPGEDRTLSENETRVAGVSTYLLRSYRDTTADDTTAARAGFTLYVGYYRQQTQGKTIHSPKNCLPGAGWEALTASVAMVETDGGGTVPVNRYLIQNGQLRALVLYWYQGRGRVAANEYAVKWHLLRDAALRRRSDEALVRIVVPVITDEAAAQALAERVARQLVPAVRQALPA